MTHNIGVRLQHGLSLPFRFSDIINHEKPANPFKKHYNGPISDSTPEHKIDAEPVNKKDSIELQQELFDAGVLCIYDIMQILGGE